MATVVWIGNAIARAQVDTITLSVLGAVGTTIFGTINGKQVTYTIASGDTLSTAATGLYNLFIDPNAPPEFQEITWSNSTTQVIVATSTNPGTPFTLTVGSTGGNTIALVHTISSSSPSDVGIAANWLRNNASSLPLTGDDVIIANSSVSLLWNLTALKSIGLNSYQRWQSFTGTIGLPENNPAGYFEYRPTYFQLGSNVASLPVTLGVGTGNGPSRERYDLQNNRANLIVTASGSAADDFAIRFLGSNPNNTISVLNTSLGIAMLPGETATIASANVSQGGTLALGPGLTFDASAAAVSSSSGSVIPGISYGTLVVNSASAQVYCAVTTMQAYNGASLTVQSNLVYATVLAQVGSTVTWNGNGTILSLTLNSSSTFQKGNSAQGMTITNSTIDGDTCQIIDPLSTITFTNPTVINNIVNVGPVQTGPGRTIKVT